MRRLWLIGLGLLLASLVSAQETIVTTSRWTDLGEHPSGIRMYVSFSLLGREISLEAADSTRIEHSATTRCRFRLSNFSDKEVLVSKINITLFSAGDAFDTYLTRKNVLLKPWQNHYGAFLTPKLRKADKTVESANMTINAKVVKQ